MTVTSTRTGALALAAVVSFAAIGSAATVVAPNAQANAQGNFTDNNKSLFGRRGDTDGQRFQQVYDAGQFAGFGATESIGSLGFRAKVGGFFFPGIFGNTVTVSDILIRLSTTARESTIDSPTNNGINGEFATNVGADVRTVYSGPLTVTTPTAGDTSFGYVINLQTPFSFTKGAGNLLLDVTIPAGATVTEGGSSGYSNLDAQTGDALGANSNDGVASAFGATAGATIGANTTTGLVTQFNTVVPEPTTLAALAGLGIAFGRRRR